MLPKSVCTSSNRFVGPCFVKTCLSKGRSVLSRGTAFAWTAKRLKEEGMTWKPT